MRVSVVFVLLFAVESAAGSATSDLARARAVARSVARTLDAAARARRPSDRRRIAGRAKSRLRKIRAWTLPSDGLQGLDVVAAARLRRRATGDLVHLLNDEAAFYLDRGSWSRAGRRLAEVWRLDPGNVRAAALVLELAERGVFVTPFLDREGVRRRPARRAVAR